MTFRVTLQPTDAQFVATSDHSLLQSALEAGFFPPHECRSGSCGRCKNQLISGRVDHGPAMFSALSAAERERGAFLFCCARPLTDLVIERRDIELPGEIRVKRLLARLLATEFPGPHSVRLTLELPSNRRLCFRAGQCVDILCPDGSRERAWLQGPPADGRELKLEVLCAAHEISTRSWAARPGDNVRIEGPYDGHDSKAAAEAR